MNNKKRLKLIALVVTIALSSSACQKQSVSSNDVDSLIDELSSETGVSKEKIKEAIVSETPSAATDILIVDEQTAVDYFSESKNNLSELSETENKDNYEKEATKYLKNVVDFVFYDKSINGVTFSKLKEESKKEIIESIESTNKILQDSGLKDIVITAAKDAKEWTLDKIAIGSVALKEIIGDKNYDGALDMADKIKQKILEKAKDVKNAVEEYKENN